MAAVLLTTPFLDRDALNFAVTRLHCRPRVYTTSLGHGTPATPDDETLGTTETTSQLGPNRTILDEETVKIAQGSWQDGPHGRKGVIPMTSYCTTDSPETVTVPEFFNSIDTLLFCGIERSIAQPIYATYADIQSGPSPMDDKDENIIEFAEDYIRAVAERYDAASSDDDEHWSEVLTVRFGCSFDLVSSIMDPSCQDIRLTATASEWVIDTLQMISEFLLSVRDRIRECKGKTRHIKGATGQASAPSFPKFTLLPFINISNLSPQQAVDALEEAASDPKATSVLLSLLNTAPKILYKGATRLRLDAAFNVQTNSLHIEKLFSTPPTDFHRTSDTTLYFTEQLEVAQKYAWYAERRVRWETVGILQLALPADKLEGAVFVEGDAWKQLVWHCRRNDQWREPKDVAPLLKENILRGTICGQSPKVVSRLSNREKLTKMKLVDGEPAMQTVFLDPETFVKGCEELVWVLSSLSWQKIVDQDLRVFYGPAVPGG